MATTGVEADLMARLLFGNFGESVSISGVENAGVGQNAGRHLVASTTDGRRFGFKVSAGGSENEALVGRIASIVKAPNARRYAFDPSPGFVQPSTLSGQPVLKTEWLSGKVDDFRRPETIVDVRASPAEFFIQFGEWMALGLFLGVGDRDNPGNWVWDRSGRRLCMIDFEYVWTTRTPEDYTRFLLREGIALTSREQWSRHYSPPGLLGGFLRMRLKLRAGFSEVKEYLLSTPASGRVGELEQLLRTPDFEAYRTIVQTVTGPRA